MNKRVRQADQMTRLALMLSIALIPGLSQADEIDRTCRNRGHMSRLKERLSSFYIASRESRWDDVYAMVAPETKRGVGTYDEFFEKFRRISPNIGTTIHIGSIECDWPDTTDPPSYAAIAEVSLRVTFERPDGKRERIRDFLSYWALVGNEWLWTGDGTSGCLSHDFRVDQTRTAP